MAESGVLRGVKLYEVTADRTGVSDAITSFADLYRNQYGPMVRLAHLLTTSNSVAEELVQDAFVRVHRKWDQIEVPRAYLRTAVMNACRSHHRRRLLEKARLGHPPLDVVSPDPDEMWDALAALPYRQRAVLVMKFYEDMPEAEIAAALGCRPGTVKSLTSRALDQLRKVIER
jgi:RNA polymerase sigma-70 factor (sigma-E family)